MNDRIERRGWLSSRRMLVAGIGLATAIVVSSPRAAQPALREFREEPGIQEFSGRLIVRPIPLKDWLADGLTATEAQLQRSRAIQILETLAVVQSVWQTDETIVAVRPSETENSLARALMGTGLFGYAEPDWIVYPIGCPNDPLLGSQWHHAANRMQSCDGWSLHAGAPSVAVGICDTGIRRTHQEFRLHRLEGYNAVDRLFESQGGNIDPVHPHGTMTTGCAAANGDNGVGISGVGWNLSHRMLRVSNDSSGYSSLSVLQHAARTSIESGDRVASVSYSGVDNASNLSTATYIKSIGGLLVWAAGNDGRNLAFGNRDADDIIVAGGTDRNDVKAGFSAYGIFVDLTAPAVGVYTTNSGSDNAYASVSGTSFATPLTAGLAALIWSYDPTQTPDQVESALKKGCDDLGTTGVDNTFGYGRINVLQSLLVVSGGSRSEVLASDGWESGNFSGGIGWSGSWTHSGDTRIRWNQDSPHAGSGHVRLRQSHGYLERAVDLSGAMDVHLKLWAKVVSFEGEDQALIRVSSDSVNFTTVRTLTAADGNDIYRSYDISLADFPMTSNFRIAIDGAMNSGADLLYIDDIRIVGIR